MVGLARSNLPPLRCQQCSPMSYSPQPNNFSFKFLNNTNISLFNYKVNKNMKVNVLVSILMTIYNAKNFLMSLRSILNQSFKNWELIAIENGSNDLSKSF